jgi:hypothetical protein
MIMMASRQCRLIEHGCIPGKEGSDPWIISVRLSTVILLQCYRTSKTKVCPR